MSDGLGRDTNSYDASIVLINRIKEAYNWENVYKMKEGRDDWIQNILTVYYDEYISQNPSFTQQQLVFIWNDIADEFFRRLNKSNKLSDFGDILSKFFLNPTNLAMIGIGLIGLIIFFKLLNKF